MMAMASFPGEYLSVSWWLWVASGLLCVTMFVALWWFYSRKSCHSPDAQAARITRPMAVFWATLVTLPGLVFAAGALWALVQMVRVWSA